MILFLVIIHILFYCEYECFLFCPCLFESVDRCLIIVPSLLRPGLGVVSRERKCDKPL